MNYKVEGAIKKNRKVFIICGVLWLFIAIVLVPPLAFSIFVAMLNGGFDFNVLISRFVEAIMHPFQSFGALVQYNEQYHSLGFYFKTLIGVTFIFAIFPIIGVVRAAPKNEYSDIEHGSSDWSQSGEQYQILSKNKGIILAEDNYLPVDKRGNVNVLVVGRIRFW